MKFVRGHMGQFYIGDIVDEEKEVFLYYYTKQILCSLVSTAPPIL